MNAHHRNVRVILEAASEIEEQKKIRISVPTVPRWKAAARQPEVEEHLGGADPHDASKGWGHVAREHGRYGSHPLHDDYEDESNS